MTAASSPFSDTAHESDQKKTGSLITKLPENSVA